MDKSQGRRQRRIPPESAPLPNSCDNSTSQFSCSAKTCEPSLISSEWPPPGLTWSMDLKQQEAEDLICHGATTFHGYYEKTQLGHRRCYAIMRTEPGTSTNQTRSPDPFTQTMSATLTGVPDPQRPWEALEHPSLMSCFGDGPGTITLNYWLGISGGPRPVVKHKPNVISRKVGLLWLLERIRSLEFGLEADPDYIYSILYESLIQVPEKKSSSHYAVETQIEDLVAVLTSGDWTDFSLTENQVVAAFFRSESSCISQRFLHQLVLAIELYLRLHSQQDQNAMVHSLRRLPAKVGWDLVMAQRWLENIAVGKTESDNGLDVYNFVLRSKRRQVEALRDFAWSLKWPNMGEVEYALEEEDRQCAPIEYRSIDAMTWFSGVILPGFTTPWLIMNTLLDCDRGASDKLERLSHTCRYSGFQYRTNTYWSWECIVGKVMGAARGVNQVAGWVGPCNYSPELERIQCVQIRQKEPPQVRPHIGNVLSMAERSDPLGTPAESYPVNDYQLVMPDTEDVVDTVRMEKLSFQPWGVPEDSDAPVIYDVAVTFAYDGLSWDIRLRYNVDFISASPCHSGPHVLFYDYTYHALKIDALLELEGWGSTKRETTTSFSSSEDHSFGGQDAPPRTKEEAEDDGEKVLVVEAFGVPDNEVCARTWCAHFGHSAITANIHTTCMACAIREAYAARITVVILSEGRKDEDVEQVDRRCHRR